MRKHNERTEGKDRKAKTPESPEVDDSSRAKDRGREKECRCGW